jgi:hypothetical protein
MRPADSEVDTFRQKNRGPEAPSNFERSNRKYLDYLLLFLRTALLGTALLGSGLLLRCHIVTSLPTAD